jgi:hypothetical protein
MQNQCTPVIDLVRTGRAPPANGAHALDETSFSSYGITLLYTFSPQ